MKIVVDKMPDSPCQCPHAVCHDARTFDWYNCSKCGDFCECKIGEHGWECPIYVGVHELMKKGGLRYVD